MQQPSKSIIVKQASLVKISIQHQHRQFRFRVYVAIPLQRVSTNEASWAMESSTDQILDISSEGPVLVREL